MCSKCSRSITRSSRCGSFISDSDHRANPPPPLTLVPGCHVLSFSVPHVFSGWGGVGRNVVLFLFPIWWVRCLNPSPPPSSKSPLVVPPVVKRCSHRHCTAPSMDAERRLSIYNFHLFKVVVLEEIRRRRRGRRKNCRLIG